jgi:SAM-dependent methyltransferase
MTRSRMSDQKLLREEAYADDRHLDVRYRTHQLYTLDPVDFVAWTLDRLSWDGDERVLDVGCGPGGLLGRLAGQGGAWGVLVGLDLSPGMAAKAADSYARLAVCFLVGDAQTLPFPDGAFDVVVAGHMLYHVPDIPRAVAEAARVLAPGGRFLATTNSEFTMSEYAALRSRAAARFPAMARPDSASHRFSLENGARFLQPDFDRVEVHTLPGVLRFPAAQPLVDYFASARSLHMRSAHTDAAWQAVLRFVQAEAQAVIEREGHFDVTKVTGALVAVKAEP